MYLTELLTTPLPRPTIKDRAKLILGAALYPSQTQRWKAFVQRHPVLRELAPALPKIIHKIYRPYLSNHLGCGARVAVLMSHYTAINDAGLVHMVRRAALAPVQLAKFDGKLGGALALHLTAINVAHREGELVLQLSSHGKTVYTLSFTLLLQDEERQLALGSLQGVRANDGAAVIRQLTRELYGWRPKNFMIAVLRDLGAYLGCEKLILVSNRNRVVVNWRRSARISSDYDTTWQELKATPRSDGNFELPCQAGSRCIDTAPSHKRSELRKRETLLSAVDRQIEEALSRLRDRLVVKQ